METKKKNTNEDTCDSGFILEIVASFLFSVRGEAV